MPRSWSAFRRRTDCVPSWHRNLIRLRPGNRWPLLSLYSVRVLPWDIVMAPGSPVRTPSASESQASRSAQQQVARIAEIRKVHQAFAWFRSHSRELEDAQLE